MSSTQSMIAAFARHIGLLTLGARRMPVHAVAKLHCLQQLRYRCAKECCLGLAGTGDQPSAA